MERDFSIWMLLTFVRKHFLGEVGYAVFSRVDSNNILHIFSFWRNFSIHWLWFWKCFSFPDKAKYTVLKINFLISKRSPDLTAHWSFFQLEMVIGSVTSGWQGILLKFTYRHILALETVRLANRNNPSCTGPACQLPIHRTWILIWAVSEIEILC